MWSMQDRGSNQDSKIYDSRVSFKLQKINEDNLKRQLRVNQVSPIYNSITRQSSISPCYFNQDKKHLEEKVCP